MLLPSDHYVAEERVLHDALVVAVRAACEGDPPVVLLGISPSTPEHGYGWILPDAPGVVSRVRRFVEKPPVPHVTGMIRDGALINSFILVSRVHVLLALIERVYPDILHAFQRLAHDPADGPAARRLYQGLPFMDLSRDVLQRASRFLSVIRVPPCGWSDLGTPERLRQYLGGAPQARHGCTRVEDPIDRHPHPRARHRRGARRRLRDLPDEACGTLAEERQDWDNAVVNYLDLTANDPGNVRWRSALLRANLRASLDHFNAGRRFIEAGVPERALLEFQQAVQLDPTNQYAQVELDKARVLVEAAQGSNRPAPPLDEMKREASRVTAHPPLLNPRSRAPISLVFPQPQSLFAIYQALGKAFGTNILFDPQLRDQDLAIELRDVTAQTALETLMRSAGHFHKVIDEHTILVAQDTPQNRKN